MNLILDHSCIIIQIEKIEPAASGGARLLRFLALDKYGEVVRLHSSNPAESEKW